ncbi:alpha-glucosidase [Pseudomaricurvus alkylphenolicus]|uniref:alpha-glucosidase family protein n=1 Tax=Pseudomaricurvus alkylphenolicus TaxID=1306991 RepID=UPI0014230DF5|nr:alpha-glucosidase family protein [Pseudomaricurvus alkylphenolicus]NIB38238.1 alpha-glucosidase [Pseudomaricurvus alkylphenolicus]
MQKVQSDQWWRGATIYQIYPRSFSDSNNDGVGDLRGITRKLDYIAELGVDGIWISPFFTSPMHDFGYDVSDYCDVDPIFGSLEDFDDLVAKAHQLDLRVIIDQVYSHTSSEHPWFQESRTSKTGTKSDWYVWADAKPDGTPPTNWQSNFSGPAWTWDNRRKQYYLHNFLSTQPDLNLHNPEVQDAILDVARFWLNRGVDGFRLDAINHAMHDESLRDNPAVENTDLLASRPFMMQEQRYNLSHPGVPEFLKKVRETTNSYGDIFTVAEVGGMNPVPVMKSYTKGSDALSSAYSFEFLGLPEPIAGAVKSLLQLWPGEPDEGWPSWAFSNHDVPRVASRWGKGEKTAEQSKLYLLLLSCLRGNLFIYQGEELGLPQGEVPFEALQDPEAIANWPDTLGRDGSRTPFPWNSSTLNAGFSESSTWLPVDAAQRAMSVETQLDQSNSILSFFKRSMSIRRQYEALRRGALELVEAPEQLLAFVRKTEQQQLLCVFNLSGESIEWEPRELEKGRRLHSLGVNESMETIPRVLPPQSGYISLLED